MLMLLYVIVVKYYSTPNFFTDYYPHILIKLVHQKFKALFNKSLSTLLKLTPTHFLGDNHFEAYIFYHLKK